MTAGPGETVGLHVGRLTGSVFVSPHKSRPDLDPKRALLAALKAARTSVTFAIYSLTDPDIAAALLDAHTRGLVVRGLADTLEATGPTSKVPGLIAAGVDIERAGSRWALMHLKVAVVDDHTVALGSYNWTVQAEDNNEEVLVFLTGSPLLVSTLTEQILTAREQSGADV